MSYRNDVLDVMDFIVSDLETIQEELSAILDMDDIEDIKIAVSEMGQTIQTLKEELR